MFTKKSIVAIHKKREDGFRFQCVLQSDTDADGTYFMKHISPRQYKYSKLPAVIEGNVRTLIIRDAIKRLNFRDAIDFNTRWRGIREQRDCTAEIVEWLKLTLAEPKMLDLID